MVNGVAQHVHQRVNQLVKDVAIDPRISAQNLKVSLLVRQSTGLANAALQSRHDGPSGYHASIQHRALGISVEVFLVNQHGVIVKKFPDEVLNGLGGLSGQVIGELAAADGLSREVMESILKFRAQSIAYAKVSEQAFYNARGLPFTWVELQ